MFKQISWLKDYVDQRIRSAVSRLVHFTFYSNSTASGLNDSVECDHNDSSAPSYNARRMQHFGLRSRPPKGVDAIRLGNWEAVSNSVIVAEDSTRFGPSDLEDGDVCIYNKVTGTEIRLRASDDTIIIKGTNVYIGDTLPTEKVMLGTTYRAHQATLDTSWSTATAFLGAALDSFTTAFADLQGEGALSPGTQSACGVASTASAAAHTASGNLLSAVTTFESGAATYLSNIVKVK